MHLFHHDLWEELAAYLVHIRFPCDLYVNLVEGNPANGHLAKIIRARFPGAHVQITENRGRDIGGFLRLIAAVRHRGQAYASVILMHSKKSFHQPPPHGASWRHSLLRCMLGTPDRASAIALAFVMEPPLGMVGARSWLFNEHLRPDLAWNQNRPLVDEYRRRFGLQNASTDFIAGTMFWARAEPFLGFFARHDPLAIAAELETGDPSDKDRPTRTHALERIFGYLITAQGYYIRGLEDTLVPSNSPGTEVFHPVNGVSARGVADRK
jgi:lipopolysaccharide biosynthesis protein